jgi:hypothetical protein
MDLGEYAAMREVENQRSEHWGTNTALWVIVAVIIILAIVFNWTRNCNEKVNFATSLAQLEGRISCMEPNVRWAGEQLYAANGLVNGVIQGVKDMNQNYGQQLFQLNEEVFYTPAQRGTNGGGCCGGNGGNNRTFAQTQNYTLASQGVTVTETCRN